jgi:predicted amidohydrolase YtcJ
MQRLKQTRYVSAFAYNVWPASLPARTVTTMTSNKLLPARPLLFSALACSFLLSACSSEESTVASPDLIVINADVHTVDSTVSRADAFAVTGGRFVAVGDTTKIRPMAGEDTVIIDAGGVSIIPGLIDGHTHLIGGAGLATGVDLSEIEDKDEWLRIIREKADSLPAGAWILGGAWNHNLSDGILPTKEMLDSVAPENPVLLRDIDFHSSWANTLAIELAGISADSEVHSLKALCGSSTAPPGLQMRETR